MLCNFLLGAQVITGSGAHLVILPSPEFLSVRHEVALAPPLLPMRTGTLVPNNSEVALVCLRPKDRAIEMQLRTCRASATCPVCGVASQRVHSRYRRTLEDLPWEGLRVTILLETRRFFCVGSHCSRNDFGNLSWPTSAVCFGPPYGTLMLRVLGSAGA